jgi:hypothetical protein
LHGWKCGIDQYDVQIQNLRLGIVVRITPVIVTTWEAAMERIVVEGQPGQNI